MHYQPGKGGKDNARLVVFRGSTNTVEEMMAMIAPSEGPFREADG